jgi:hypothetical protein
VCQHLEKKCCSDLSPERVWRKYVIEQNRILAQLPNCILLPVRSA